MNDRNSESKSTEQMGEENNEKYIYEEKISMEDVKEELMINCEIYTKNRL